LKNKISIPSDFSYLRDVENFIQGILEDIHASDFISGYINLCVSESVNNAIYHGNKQDLNKHVTIFAECKDDCLLVEVADEGTGFNYEDLPDPTLTENLRKEGGRGLFIIKNLVDQISFKNNGSIIQLKFKLNSEHQFLYRRHFRSSSG
jgi:serine/threonine-protein kinase RsbW